MKLITAANQKALDKNRDKDLDQVKPAMKLFTPWGSATWLVVSMEADGDTLWTIADIGMGEVEYGTVSLRELMGVRGPFGLKVERDMHWTAEKTAREYLEAGWAAGRIAA